MEAKEIENLVASQKNFFRTHATVPVAWRKLQLKRLKESLKLHEEELIQALKMDLGKSGRDAYMSEIGLVYSEISYMLKHLNSLACPHPVYTPLHEFPSLSETIAIPYGSVLIMSPWNYPVYLTLVPLVDAMAAGNTAVLKPSDYSAHVSEVLDAIITETFDSQYIGIVKGGRQENQSLLDQPFDYIFFTGSKAVGQLVMEKAAVHMIPFTLELGGKSPCIVDETSNLKLAAKRIVFGKFLNAGQTCVAPDYVVVQDSVHDEFIAQLKHEIAMQYPNPGLIGRIINQKHFDRLKSLVDPAKVVYGGVASDPTLQIAPTVLDHVSWNDPVMQEEIFGPILPVMTYSSFTEIMTEIEERPTPLAFYLFTRDEARKEYYKKVQPFGGGCINDTVIQLSNDHLPFGGMGASGIGKYHGKFGFETLSHTKAVLEKAQWLDLPMRYANAGQYAEKLIRFFLK